MFDITVTCIKHMVTWKGPYFGWDTDCHHIPGHVVVVVVQTGATLSAVLTPQQTGLVQDDTKEQGPWHRT